MSFLKIILAILLIASVSRAQECRSFFLNNKSQLHGKILFRGYFKTSRGAIYTKIEKPQKQPKHWVVLVHGLLDSHRGWNEVSRHLLENGVGVVRVDLLGHGKTLRHQHRAELESRIFVDPPYKIKVEENVLVLKEVLEILEEQGIRNPSLVGHSMGGAVALEASRVLPVHPSTILIAPYIYRLDRRLLEKVVPKYFWGFDSSIFDLMPNFYREFIERWITDYFADPIMARTYREFAVEKILEEDESLTLDQLKWLIRHQIKYAISTTKGLREFDGFEVSGRLPPKNKYLVLVGERDELLDMELQKKFSQALPNGKIHIYPEGQHMLISEQPKSVSQKILKFLGVGEKKSN